MPSSRRQFLTRGSAAALATLLPATAWARSGSRRRTLEADIAALRAELPHAGDPAIADYLSRAVEAATRAGATYADARFQMIDTESFGKQTIGVNPPLVTHDAGIGVRALYNGYWAYASIPAELLTTDGAATLGATAAAQAKILAGNGKARDVVLAAAGARASGSWTMPVEIDPFTVSWEEKTDYLNGWMQYVGALPFGAGLMARIGCTRMLQMFASSEGGAFSQTTFNTGAQTLGITSPSHWRTKQGGFRSLDGLASSAGAGWEYMRTIPFEAELPRYLEQANDVRLAESIDPGRYDIVFDGAAVARLADAHLGFASELDRAMGYLANRDGTSYLNDPLAMLGTQQVGAPLLNVSANRSMPGGAANVKWDDEGVEPDAITLVRNGMLTDYQTTRESASWLADHYRKTGQPIRSHGGATRSYISDETQQGPSNLVIAPAKDDTSFEALCAGVKKGLAVFSGQWQTDFQQLNSDGTGDVVYEIVNGKLGRTLKGGIFAIRAPEFWKNLVALGGAQTVCRLGLDTHRQDTWNTYHTVAAPAAAFRQVAVTTQQVITR